MPSDFRRGVAADPITSMGDGAYSGSYGGAYGGNQPHGGNAGAAGERGLAGLAAGGGGVPSPEGTWSRGAAMQYQSLGELGPEAESVEQTTAQGHSLGEVASRRHLSVHFGKSLGEIEATNVEVPVQDSPSVPGWGDSASAVSASPLGSGGRGGSRIRGRSTSSADLFRDAREVRAQLDAKRRDLVAALQAQQQTETTLRHVLAERQSLHGEVRLLQHRVSELESSLEAERRRRESVEQRCSQAESQCQELERQSQQRDQRSQELERKCRKAEQRGNQAHSKLQEVEKLKSEAERRFEEAERSVAEGERRFRDAEQHWELKAEARVQEEKLRDSESTIQRQNEIRSALLELQALSQGQQMLRSELRRALRPMPVVNSYVAPSIHMDDALERMQARITVDQRAMPHPSYSLLSAKVRDQAAYLDKQMRQLEDRRHER